MRINIDHEISGGAIYATSVELWAFTGDLGLGSIALKIYLSDGSDTISLRYEDYEATASRKKGDNEPFPDGYYRFSTVTCYYDGDFITYPEVWTD